MSELRTADEIATAAVQASLRQMTELLTDAEREKFSRVYPSVPMKKLHGAHDLVFRTLKKRGIEELPGRFVDVVFDGEPGPDGPVFVETEDAQGRGIKLGNWVKREDDYWVLRITSGDLA